MRTITDDFDTLYSQPASMRSVFVKVEVDRSGAGSDFVDLTSFDGRDFVKSWSYSGSIDRFTSELRVRFMLCDGVDPTIYNLSPEMSSSLLNDGGVLLQPYRQVKFSVAVLRLGDKPEAADFTEVFSGRIFTVDYSLEGVEILCRDQGGEIADLFIQNTDVYGNDGGSEEVEEVMQALLTTWGPSPAVTLRSVDGDVAPFPGPVSPSYAIKQYEQQMQNLQQALQILTDQTGFTLRYRFLEPVVNDWALVLEAPIRTAPSVDRSFSVDQIINLGPINKSLDRIRNLIVGSYIDDEGRPFARSVTDAPSVTNFGTRYMRINEGTSSQITTSTEMDDFTNSALSDLKDANPRFSALVIPYFWQAQLNDYYTIEANNELFDTDLSAAVLGYTHAGNQGGMATTTLQLEGLPKNLLLGHTSKQEFWRTAKTGARNQKGGTGRNGRSLTVNGRFEDFDRY